MGFKIGDRVEICKVAYRSCTEDGYPFLEPGNKGTILMSYDSMSDSHFTLYDLIMDDDTFKHRSWAFYQHELKSE